MGKISKVAAVLLTVAATGAMSVGTAVAAPAPVPKVTGGVELGAPLQYADFSAFASTPAKGSIAYTNFSLPTPGTGVWTLANTVPINFNIGGGVYSHVMTVTSLTANGPHSLAFTATGVYTDPSYTWVGSGTVDGSSFTLGLVYTGANPGYSLQLTGTIAPDGSISGSETGDSVGTFTTPTGAANEVFSYTTAVTCAQISGNSAVFGFTIPAGLPYGNSNIVVNVVDGGTPGTSGDTWAHGSDSGPGACAASSVTPFPVIGGNLVVH